MRRIAVGLFAAFAVCAMLTGCPSSQPYYGKVTIEKVDGKVTSVKVVLPNKVGNREANFTLQSREELDTMIGGLESLLLDLKSARDQMQVKEPPPK